MSLDARRDLLIDAGAALRAAGLVRSPVQSQLDRAVWQVGQALYGRNSGHVKLQRESIRAALKIVSRARGVAGAPKQLGEVEMLLRVVLRNLKGR